MTKIRLSWTDLVQFVLEQVVPLFSSEFNDVIVHSYMCFQIRERGA